MLVGEPSPPVIPGFVCAMSSDGAERASLYPSLALRASLDAGAAQVLEDEDPKALPPFPSSAMPSVLIPREKQHLRGLKTADVRLLGHADVILEGSRSEEGRVEGAVAATLAEGGSTARPFFGPLSRSGRRLKRFGHKKHSSSFSNKGAIGHSLVQLWAASSRQKPQPNQSEVLGRNPKDLPHPQLSSFSEPSPCGGSPAAALASVSVATECATMVTAPAHLDPLRSEGLMGGACTGLKAYQGWPPLDGHTPDVPCWESLSPCDVTSAAPALGVTSAHPVVFSVQLAMRTRQVKRRRTEHGDVAAQLAGAACIPGTPETDRELHADRAEEANRGTSQGNLPGNTEGRGSLGVDSPVWRQGGGCNPRTGIKRGASGALHFLPFKIQRTASGADSACGASACDSPEVASSAQKQSGPVPCSTSHKQAQAESHASQGRSGSQVERATSAKPPLATSGKPVTATSPEAHLASAGRAGLGASLGLNQDVLDTIQSKLASSGERVVMPKGEEGEGEVDMRVSEEGSLGSLSTGAILALCRSRKGCGTQPLSAPREATNRRQASEEGGLQIWGNDVARTLASASGQSGSGLGRRYDGKPAAGVSPAAMDELKSPEWMVPHRVLDPQGSVNFKGKLPQASTPVAHTPDAAFNCSQDNGLGAVQHGHGHAPAGLKEKAEGTRHAQDCLVSQSDPQITVNRQTSLTDECRGCTPSLPLRFPSGEGAHVPDCEKGSPLPPGEL